MTRDNKDCKEIYKSRFELLLRTTPSVDFSHSYLLSHLWSIPLSSSLLNLASNTAFCLSLNPRTLLKSLVRKGQYPLPPASQIYDLCFSDCTTLSTVHDSCALRKKGSMNNTSSDLSFNIPVSSMSHMRYAASQWFLKEYGSTDTLRTDSWPCAATQNLIGVDNSDSCMQSEGRDNLRMFSNGQDRNVARGLLGLRLLGNLFSGSMSVRL